MYTLRVYAHYTPYSRLIRSFNCTNTDHVYQCFLAIVLTVELLSLSPALILAALSLSLSAATPPAPSPPSCPGAGGSPVAGLVSQETTPPLLTSRDVTSHENKLKM